MKKKKKVCKRIIKTASDKRSEEAYKITANVKRTAIETLLMVRSGLRYV